MAADKESGSSVFFVPGICSRYAICPGQQAHVFLPVLPSPLLVRIRGRRKSPSLTLGKPEGRPQQEGGSAIAGLGSHFLTQRFGQDAPLCFLDSAVRMAGTMQGSLSFPTRRGAQPGATPFRTGEHHPPSGLKRQARLCRDPRDHLAADVFLNTSCKRVGQKTNAGRDAEKKKKTCFLLEALSVTRHMVFAKPFGCCKIFYSQS